MKKIIILAAAAIMLAGCAALVPVSKVDWNAVNSADLDNLKAGKIALAPEVVAEAAAEVLKAEGFNVEPAAADAGTITTVRKHGVTFYGSCDYAMSCRVAEEAGLSKLNWAIISYVSEFITNTDPINPPAADAWNTAVYKRLMEKGTIAKEIKPEKTVVPAAETAGVPAAALDPVVKDTDLPPPPAAEE